MSNTFDLDIHVLTFSFFKSGQNDILALFCTRNSIQHNPKAPENEQSIVMYNTFDLDIDALTFDLSK